MSVHTHGTHRLPLTNFDEIWYLSFFRESVEKIQVSLNTTRITGTLIEDVLIFITISRSILLRMRNVSNKSCRENQNTHFTFSNFFSENHAVYEIMSKNLVESDDNMAPALYMLDK